MPRIEAANIDRDAIGQACVQTHFGGNTVVGCRWRRRRRQHRRRHEWRRRGHCTNSGCASPTLTALMQPAADLIGVDRAFACQARHRRAWLHAQRHQLGLRRLVVTLRPSLLRPTTYGGLRMSFAESARLPRPNGQGAPQIGHTHTTHGVLRGHVSRRRARNLRDRQRHRPDG
jgi:hypothetical protein